MLILCIFVKYLKDEMTLICSYCTFDWNENVGTGGKLYEVCTSVSSSFICPSQCLRRSYYRYYVAHVMKPSHHLITAEEQSVNCAALQVSLASPWRPGLPCQCFMLSSCC